VDIFSTQLDPATITARSEDHPLGVITLLHAKSTTGETLTFLPYHLWGNRGAAQMVVWINCQHGE
jgi:DUF1680 family protein